MIPLVKDTIENYEFDNLIEWLKTRPRLTKGPLTKEFEQIYANWLGVKHSIYVNSGSSANFLMLYALKIMNKLKNKKIVVPGLCWVTDVSPVMQLELNPILCDCNLNDLSIDLDHLESIFIEEKPSVLMLVSVLGLCPDMEKIVNLCEKYDVILLEDACESMGSKFGNRKLGSFGLMSSNSMFFGHHISSIEGGLVNTNDHEIYNIVIALRNHGWNRDWSDEDKQIIETKYNIQGINKFYTFYYPGLNMRSTDLQAFIAISQMKKLDLIIEKRNRNYLLYKKLIKNDYFEIKDSENSFISNFAFPIIHPNREKIINLLIENGIETRPLICGSMGKQPFYVDYYGEKELPNCNIVDKYGIYIPNNPFLTEEEIYFVSTIVNKGINT